MLSAVMRLMAASRRESRSAVIRLMAARRLSGGGVFDGEEEG